MPLTNCKINLILIWSSATGETKFAITDAKLYVPITSFSTQDNAKLFDKIWF